MKKWLRSLWKGSKRDNRGLTLVELICTIAIFGVVCTAVGSVMVISARTYGRSNDEINLQQEAQLTANQIADILIDATTEINYDQDTKVMVVKNGDAHYTVALDDTTLRYTQTFADGRTNSGVLAENVTDFKMQAEDFTTSGNARVYLKLQVDQKEYDAWYTVTARNGDVTGQAILENTATINTINEVTLEPNEVCKLGDYTSVYGTSDDKTVSWSNPSEGGATSPYTRITENGELTIGGDEMASSFTVTVSTNARDGVTPIDVKSITVRVRRVREINVSGVNVSGTDKTAGAEYRVSANAQGSNLARVYGVDYDDAAHYKNPYYVHFDYYMTIDGSNANIWEYIEYTSLQINGDSSAPTVSFKLRQNIPVGGKLKVVAKAKHPLGTDSGVKTNKTGLSYGNIVGEWVLEGPTAVNNPHTIGGDGILRGSTQFHVGFNSPAGNETYLKTTYLSSSGNQGTVRTYWRYREVGSSEWSWSGWRLFDEQGTDYHVQPGNNVNIYMRPDKDYELQLESKVMFNDEVCWPVADTPVEYYRSTFIISHVYFSVKSSWPSAFENKLGVGSYSSPFVVSKSSSGYFTFAFDKMYGTDAGYLQSRLVMDIKNLTTGNTGGESCVDVSGLQFKFGNAEPGLYKITFRWVWGDERPAYSENVPGGEAGAGIFYIKVNP